MSEGLTLSMSEGLTLSTRKIKQKDRAYISEGSSRIIKIKLETVVGARGAFFFRR